MVRGGHAKQRGMTFQLRHDGCSRRNGRIHLRLDGCDTRIPSGLVQRRVGGQRNGIQLVTKLLQTPDGLPQLLHRIGQPVDTGTQRAPSGRCRLQRRERLHALQAPYQRHAAAGIVQIKPGHERGLGDIGPYLPCDWLTRRLGFDAAARCHGATAAQRRGSGGQPQKPAHLAAVPAINRRRARGAAGIRRGSNTSISHVVNGVGQTSPRCCENSIWSPA
ncbi:MAG: hypothetical protein GAK34_03718 [Delftia tsuruhatensis]|nr:MAG: hypothetical protein GAK34_03718 [Delftia tsuruhatensis]